MEQAYANNDDTNGNPLLIINLLGMHPGYHRNIKVFSQAQLFRPSSVKHEVFTEQLLGDFCRSDSFEGNFQDIYDHTVMINCKPFHKCINALFLHKI